LLSKASPGLSAMILTKVRFENQQKKTPQAKKNKSKLCFFSSLCF